MPPERPAVLRSIRALRIRKLRKPGESKFSRNHRVNLEIPPLKVRICLSPTLCKFRLLGRGLALQRGRRRTRCLTGCVRAARVVLARGTAVCEKTIILRRPVPCGPAAETALHPLIWCSASLHSDASSSLHGRRHRGSAEVLCCSCSPSPSRV